MTKRLKESVRRNLKRFPPDFMFELTQEEFVNLRSQFASSSWGGSRYLPFAFTEHGVTALANILNSDKAIEMGIAIVRAFIALKQAILKQRKLSEQIAEFKRILEQRIDEHDTQLAAIYETIETLLDKKVSEEGRLEKWKKRDLIGYKNK